MKRAVALLASVGCAHEALYVQPRSLANARGRIVAGEHVSLETEQGDRVDLGPDHVVELVMVDGKHVPMRLDALVKNCPEQGEDAQQLCDVPGVQYVIIGDKRRMSDNASSLLRGTLAIGILVGLPVCAFECSSPYNYISDGVMIVGGALAIAALVILARNFGRPMT